MARRRPVIERVDEVLEQLRQLSEEGVPVIVEGSKDEAALRSFGVLGKVYKIGSAATSLPMLAETLSIQAEKAIMLTDFDHQGDSLAQELERLLISHGVNVETGIRNRLRGLTRASHVEGLPRRLARLRNQ